MRMYYLWASTYKSVDLMERHRKSDYALDLLSSRVSDTYHVLAETPQDAAKQFRESIQFEAFLSRNISNPVFIYCSNDSDVLVRLDT